MVSLQEMEQKRFVVSTEKLVESNCILLLVLYCNDITEDKNTSAVCYASAVRRHCAKDTMSKGHIISSETASES